MGGTAVGQIPTQRCKPVDKVTLAGPSHADPPGVIVGADAIAWVNHPDAAAQWMGRTGICAHPRVFVSRLQNIVRIDENA